MAQPCLCVTAPTPPTPGCFELQARAAQLGRRARLQILRGDGDIVFRAQMDSHLSGGNSRHVSLLRNPRMSGADRAFGQDTAPAQGLQRVDPESQLGNKLVFSAGSAEND